MMEQEEGKETKMQSAEKFIDLDDLIKSKNPNLLKFIPRFLINYLKRVIHQDEVNAAISRNKTLFGVDFIEKILEEFKAKIETIHPENIPARGRYIIASNHPLGGMDGMALLLVVGQVKKDIIFPVNDLLMNLPNLKCLFIPINKHGRNTENAKIFEETFASEQMILYFPAGLCSRQKKGIIKDLEWKKTFVGKAKQYKRDVIPVHIDGQNSKFFYRLANLRKFFGIKANLEMLYLVDEMYKQRDKKICITFGKTIPYSTFDKRFSDKDWAAKVKDHVYGLSINKDKVFEY
jgi:putative hemolysin